MLNNINCNNCKPEMNTATDRNQKCVAGLQLNYLKCPKCGMIFPISIIDKLTADNIKEIERLLRKVEKLKLENVETSNRLKKNNRHLFEQIGEVWNE